MRDIAAELKELRLHGMVGVWADLMGHGESGNDGSFFGVTRKKTIKCLQRAIFNSLPGDLIFSYPNFSRAAYRTPERHAD